MALFQEEPEEYLRQIDNRLLKQKGLNRKDVDKLVQQRSEARRSKNYKESDQIRSELTSMGISVMDSTEGSIWEVDKSGSLEITQEHS